jgi:hypothetical protein
MNAHLLSVVCIFRTTTQFMVGRVRIISTQISLVVGVIRYSLALSKSNDTNTENAHTIIVLELLTNKRCETRNKNAKNEASGMYKSE